MLGAGFRPGRHIGALTHQIVVDVLVCSSSTLSLNSNPEYDASINITFYSIPGPFRCSAVSDYPHYPLSGRFCPCSGGGSATPSASPSIRAVAGHPWVFSGSTESCDVACARDGGVCCHSCALLPRTSAEMSAVIALTYGLSLNASRCLIEAGGSSRSDHNVQTVQSTTGCTVVLPSFLCSNPEYDPSSNTCYYSTPGFSCSAVSDYPSQSGSGRFCPCGGSASPTPSPSASASQWIFSDSGDSCDTACAVAAKICCPACFTLPGTAASMTSLIAATSGLPSGVADCTIQAGSSSR